MTGRPADHDQGTAGVHDGAFRLVVLMVVVLVALSAVRIAADAWSSGQRAGSPGVIPPVTEPFPSAAASIDPRSYLEAEVRPAPALALAGPTGAISLASMRGGPVLVFFGYTHCPDVCPATIGTVGLAIDAFGPGAQALFVSVDPERDTLEWLEEFVRFMPTGFSAVTGTAAEIRATADAWGVRYARVESDDPRAYQMAHTADVFVVDADGMLRARLPFGTDAPTMTAVLREVAATPAEPVVQTPPATAEPSVVTADLDPVLVSSSVWAGGSSPVIFTLGATVPAGSVVTVEPQTADGQPSGPPATAVAVQPSGIETVSFVATVDLPVPGAWTFVVRAEEAAGNVHAGILRVNALDPGGTAPLGAPAPTARTQTAADVDGDLTWITTDPLPDRRLSATSTADALAAGTPFVLVVDSSAFRVTPACGLAIVMAKRLLDRWGSVPFIHHEPYRYSVVTTEPVLEGTLTDPHLTDVAEAWGIGAEPWGVGSMPWIFIVDGDGILRAKYQGVMGSADVDVILSLLAGEG